MAKIIAAIIITIKTTGKMLIMIMGPVVSCDYGDETMDKELSVVGRPKIITTATELFLNIPPPRDKIHVAFACVREDGN